MSHAVSPYRWIQRQWDAFDFFNGPLLNVVVVSEDPGVFPVFLFADREMHVPDSCLSRSNRNSIDRNGLAWLQPDRLGYPE